MKFKLSLYISLFISLPLIGVGQKTVEGVNFSKTLSYSGKSLVLNGAGLREKMFLDLYVAGLYVEQKTQDANAIIHSDNAMVMQIQIVSSLITGEKMAEATKEGFTKAMNGNIKPLEAEINAFIAEFKNAPFKVGSQCSIKFKEGNTVELYINNSLKKTIKNQEFKKNLLKIWLGTTPVDATLKNQLLEL